MTQLTGHMLSKRNCFMYFLQSLNFFSQNQLRLSPVLTATSVVVACLFTFSITGCTSLSRSAAITSPAAGPMTLSTSNLGFGSVVVGSHSEQILQLTSNSIFPITISATVPTNPRFTLAGTSFPLVVDPGATTSLLVVFEPIAATPESGQLTLINSSASELSTTITLTGSGVASSKLATVSIEPAAGQAIPASFLGLSHEWKSAQAIMGDSISGTNDVYRQLLSNLTAYESGPLLIRIGGNSTDETGEPTSDETRPFAELAAALGVRFSLGINLRADDVGLAVDQARAYVSQMPPNSLSFVEIGNEPDNYAINGFWPTPYTYQDYQEKFEDWRNNIVPLLQPGTTLMGPSWGGIDCKWLSYSGTFDAAEAATLGVVSTHYYIGNGAIHNPADMLLTQSAATAGPQLMVQPASEAHIHFIPFRVGELNSLDMGGEEGISNAFESTLWSVDTMFEYVRAGVDGVNWQIGGSPTNPYNAFSVISSKTGSRTTYSMQVNALYYGLLFFQAATGNTSHLTPATLDTGNNVKAWATTDKSQITRLVLINKEKATSGIVDVSAAGFSSAQVIRLCAPSFLSKSGISFAGQTFDGSTDGLIHGTEIHETFASEAGLFHIPMGATSAAIIQFAR